MLYCKFLLVIYFIYSSVYIYILTISMTHCFIGPDYSSELVTTSTFTCEPFNDLLTNPFLPVTKLQLWLLRDGLTHRRDASTSWHNSGSTELKLMLPLASWALLITRQAGKKVLWDGWEKSFLMIKGILCPASLHLYLMKIQEATTLHWLGCEGLSSFRNEGLGLPWWRSGWESAC